MMRRRLLLLPLLFLLLASGRVRAQAPDSARMTAEVRQGFAALELYGQSGSLEHAAQAARHFSQAIKSDADDPWAHYGLGATLFSARKTMAIIRTLGVADGEAGPVAQRALERALDLAPDFIGAAELLAQAAENPKNRDALHRAYAVLAKHGRLPADPVAPEAEAAGATGQLRRARSLFEKGDDGTGAEAYFAGVDSWDEAAAQAYVEDALLIAAQSEVVPLTDGTLEKRRQALRRFWQKRTVRDGVSAAERIGEHYRRIAYARSRYRMRSQERSVHDVYGNKRVGAALEIEDRGLVYIRFGEPAEYHRRDVGGSIDPRRSESWAYRKPDGSYDVFHFTDGRLVADLMASMGNPLQGDLREAAEAYNEMARYDPRYAFMAARLETLRTWAMTDGGNIDLERLRLRRAVELMEDLRRQNERISDDNRERIFEAFHRDAAAPRFERPLTVYHDFATFRGSGCTDLVYTVAAPVPSFRVTLAVADTFFWEGRTVDAIAAHESAPGGHVRATGVLCTAPDHNAFARLNVTADSGRGATAGGELTVPDYSDHSQLLLSDLLFATTTPGPFRRGDARLALVPPRQFKAGEAFRVFYELYNLPAGRSYRTEITFETVRSNPLARLFRGRSRMTVAFEDEARTGGMQQELRTLVPEIEPGEVRITVKVTDALTRASASRRETIWILPEE